MKSFFLYVLLIAALFFSFCKKHTEEPAPEEIPPIAYETYSALKVGNYWIYNLYEVDSLGNETPLNVYDSCYVQKDTVVNNKTYFKVYRPDYAIYNYLYLRDSLHYIVDMNGMILFSSLDFSTQFYRNALIEAPNDTFYIMTAKMENRNKLISVPRGTFAVSDFEKIYTFTHFPSGSFMKKRSIVTSYSKGIGLVFENLTFYSSQSVQKERKLVRYHLN